MIRANYRERFAASDLDVVVRRPARLQTDGVSLGELILPGAVSWLQTVDLDEGHTGGVADATYNGGVSPGR